MNKNHFFLLVLISILVTSCFKEDKIIPRHSRGDVKTDTIALTDNYKNQIYFDLSSGTVKGQNLKDITDIGFQCGVSGWEIILNTADFVRVADMGAVPFGASYDTTGAHWKFDKSNGNPDSLGIGNWFNVNDGDTVSRGHLFVINRGFDKDANNFGLVQFTIDSLKNGTYYFRWAKINGSNPVSASVTKVPGVSFRWYSFTSPGKTVDTEPPENSWDLLFTQYTTLLFTDKGAAYPYLVTGVLLNRYNVTALVDSLHPFASIDLSVAGSMMLKHDLDAIGYDWKEYSFVTGGYAIKLNRNYIIRDTDGLLYKMRFISFYNSSGEKGYPVIEYQEL